MTTCDCQACDHNNHDADALAAKVDRIQAFLPGWDAWRLLSDKSDRIWASFDAKQALRDRLAARKG